MRPFSVKAVVFDFDGTLTRPGELDFEGMRLEMGCPPAQGVLEYLEELGHGEEARRGWDILERHEMRAAARARPNQDAEAVVLALREMGIPLAVLTRNSRAAVMCALEQFERIRVEDFACLVTRDEDVPAKPHPDGVLWIASRFNVAPEALLMVGDFAFDMDAGRRAGAVTAFLENGEMGQQLMADADFRLSRLAQVLDVVRLGLPLPTGKIPNDLLEIILDSLDFRDPRLLVAPSVGEDIAAVQLKGEGVLVLKSDPITFPTQDLGSHLITINANDVATSGAVPRWMLVTLLYPPQTTASRIWYDVRHMARACEEINVVLVGGHTEITDAVTRTVVSGTLLGTASPKALHKKCHVKPKDVLVMTKTVGLEGTAILASEKRVQLLDSGLTREEVEIARSMGNHISVFKEARIAACIQGVSTMHDVTEGGLATAVRELAHAGKCGIVLEWDRIPVHRVTRKVCEILGLHPLGLIGSGNLLITCREPALHALLQALDRAGIQATIIGRISHESNGVSAVSKGQAVDWPVFSRDELARVLDSGEGPASTGCEEKPSRCHP